MLVGLDVRLAYNNDVSLTTNMVGMEENSHMSVQDQQQQLLQQRQEQQRQQMLEDTGRSEMCIGWSNMKLPANIVTGITIYNQDKNS